MKKAIGATNCLYPMPTVLIGTTVNGQPNYLTAAHVGIITVRLVTVSLGKAQHSVQGILENRTFSINIPNQSLLKETDYCGLVSGRDVDKSQVFGVTYGELLTAPLIPECPVSMECKVIDVREIENHLFCIAEIVQTHVDEGVLTDGQVDPCKVNPILSDMNRRCYWSLGKKCGECWEAGRQFEGGTTIQMPRFE